MGRLDPILFTIGLQSHTLRLQRPHPHPQSLCATVPNRHIGSIETGTSQTIRRGLPMGSWENAHLIGLTRPKRIVVRSHSFTSPAPTSLSHAFANGKSGINIRLARGKGPCKLKKKKNINSNLRGFKQLQKVGRYKSIQNIRILKCGVSNVQK